MLGAGTAYDTDIYNETMPSGAEEKKLAVTAPILGPALPVVETAELESATPCMSSKYSNQLSYASVFDL